MSVDCVVIVPMLGRPHTVDPLAESLYATTDRCRLLFVCTAGDRDVIAAVRGHDHMIVAPKPRGDYPAKINHGYRNSTERLLFLGGCDIKFHDGWYEAATGLLTRKVRVVGTNDLGSGRTATGDLSTHTLVARNYADKWGTIDEPGKVLHEGYWHEGCDDELCETAKYRNMWAHAPDSHVEHLHPAHGKARWDRLYRQTPLRQRQGLALLNRRRRLWT